MSATKKKLRAAAVRFRKSEPALHYTVQQLVGSLASCILKSGKQEVAVGLYKGQYYENE